MRDAKRKQKSEVTIIGTGRLGTTLAVALSLTSSPPAVMNMGSRSVAEAAPTNTNTNAKAPSTPQPAETGDELSAGKELYAAKCTICHKDTGQGGKVTVEGKNLKPADLTSEKMKARSDDKMVAGISEGAPDDGMPAFEDKLTKDQIKSIVKYVRSLQQ